MRRAPSPVEQADFAYGMIRWKRPEPYDRCPLQGRSSARQCSLYETLDGCDK